VKSGEKRTQKGRTDQAEDGDGEATSSICASYRTDGSKF